MNSVSLYAVKTETLQSNSPERRINTINMRLELRASKTELSLLAHEKPNICARNKAKM